MAGPPDLFVVCKSCGEQVSPYITECPYCGNRLRKRAPKLDKGGVPKPPRQRRRRPSPPSLSRLRPGEIPGIRADGKPFGTAALVLGAIVFTILIRAAIVDLSVTVIGGDQWYRYAAGVFTYLSTAYEAVVLSAVFLFGWLLERRHGLWAPLAVFALGSAAGIGLAVALQPDDLIAGGNAGALALLGAWVVRDLIALRHNAEIDADMLGVACIAVLLLLLPAAFDDASPLAGIGGALTGLVVGHALARLPER